MGNPLGVQLSFAEAVSYNTGSPLLKLASLAGGLFYFVLFKCAHVCSVCVHVRVLHVYVRMCACVHVCGCTDKADSLGVRVVGGCELPAKPRFTRVVSAELSLQPLRKPILKTRNERPDRG